MRKTIGYYRFPTIWNDTIAFVSESDIWLTNRESSEAHRLTQHRGIITSLLFSPDGKYLAYVSNEDGASDLYVLPIEEGNAERVTFWGAIGKVVGWSKDSKTIYFTSNAWQPFRHLMQIYAVPRSGGDPKPLPYGFAHSIAFEPDGKGVLLGRNTYDYARWKRYRGGMKGSLWIDRNGTGKFRPFLHNIDGNVNSPMWIEDRIYFLSDHEGFGNLYSVTTTGEDLQKHTDHTDFYPRNASTDGKAIIYHAGGNLYLYDIATAKASELPIKLISPRSDLKPKYVPPAKYLESFSLHPEGHSLLITTRGKSFFFLNWDGPVLQIGKPQGVRYRMSQWTLKSQSIITVSDASGEEQIEIFSPHAVQKSKRKIPNANIGHIVQLTISPNEESVAIVNHRKELMVFDMKNRKWDTIDKSNDAGIQGINWSPDSRWLVYSISEKPHTYSIKIYDRKTKKVHQVTSPTFRDIDPAFSPDGKYLFFLSYREFNPVYDSLYFDLGFPKGARPYIILLQKNTLLPFDQEEYTRFHSILNPKSKEQKNSNSSSSTPTVKIDFEGIEHRIYRLPVPENRYVQIESVESGIFLLSYPPTGSLESEQKTGQLGFYNFQKKKYIALADDVQAFGLSANSKYLVYQTFDKKLRVCPIDQIIAQEKLPAGTNTNEADGWIDLNRVKVEIHPSAEFQQILKEVWRLERDYFWREDMGKIAWDEVLKKYLAILPKIATRDELSDLLWELQGELGTSHAYEVGGDYPLVPQYLPSFLGADFHWDERKKNYIITRIYRGDIWDETKSSPLARPGVQLSEGDRILAINGRAVGETKSLYESLLHKQQVDIALTIQPKGSNKKRTVIVKTLKNETPLRYREWVKKNRDYVRKVTNNQLGYVHIPDMGPNGFAEFHRNFLHECSAEGLIVDLRFNAGGHVSQLILEKLLRRPLAYIFHRYSHPQPYPAYAISGPIVAIANEYTGSDGDIFTHTFKMLKIGPVIGKRTWGGVVGISPRHYLVDGTLITQPEFSFWFSDVGWAIENFGATPDIEVDVPPQAWSAEQDPQLDKAIEVAMKLLQKHKAEKPPKFGSTLKIAVSNDDRD